MALSVTNFSGQKRSFLGAKMKQTIGAFTGPASYASGGEVLTLAIAKAAFGMQQLYSLEFTPLVKASDGTSVGLVFDHNPSAGVSHGKIRALASGVGAHAHDLLVKGGTAAAGTDALNIKTAIVGKEAASDATALGVDSATKGGVLTTTAGTTGAELAATTNLSTYVGRFVARGI